MTEPEHYESRDGGVRLRYRRGMGVLLLVLVVLAIVALIVYLARR